MLLCVNAIAGIEWLSLVGGLSSPVALDLNLYTLIFRAEGAIKKHADAANDLVDIREAY